MNTNKLFSFKVDLHLIDFCISKLKKYVTWRYSIINKQQKRIWEKGFGNNDFIYQQLSDKYKIKLYKDSELSWLIHKGFEIAEIDFVKRVLQKDDIFIDIGANVGLYSIIASEIIGTNGKVYCFEPTPKTFERLNENIHLNQINNINPFPLGVSDSNDELVFYSYRNASDVLNSFAAPYKRHDYVELKVKTIKLDDFVSQINANKITLIKIDVEGWELPVIMGAKQALTNSNHITLLVEFTEKNAENAGYYCKEIFQLIQSYGYNWFSYDMQKEELLIESLRDRYPYCNLIATKDHNKLSKLIKSKSLKYH